MLTLLIGRSGSGKTRWILDRLGKLTEEDRGNIWLLVPEQNSFENERALLRALGPQKANRVRVVSFTRLADTVFREVGGLCATAPDDGTRALLMSRALDQAAALEDGAAVRGLRIRMPADAEAIRQLPQLKQESGQCGIDTDAWELAAASIRIKAKKGKSSSLAEKAQSLCTVFAAYEGLLKDAGLEDTDKLTRLADAMDKSTLFDGAAVFVDGFKGFTVQEEKILARLMPRAKELTVSLGTDTPGEAWPGKRSADCAREYPLFSPVTQTVRHLCRIAADCGRTWELELLTDNRRAQDGALRALENGLYRPDPERYEGPADAVTVTACDNIYEECDAAARTVRRLLRQEGWRCRDITVVMRHPETYEGILQDAFAQADIPCSWDARLALLCQPLIVYVRTALRIAAGGYRTEDILRLLKTDLTALSPVETALIENYTYTWRIDGAGWDKEWTQNPDGMDAPADENTVAVLAQLNAHREQIIAPLRDLRLAMRGDPTGRSVAEALYRYLTADPDLPGRIVRQSEQLEMQNEFRLADHAARLWDEMMALLDRLVTALGNEPLPAARWEELFTMLVQTVDMGHIPQSVDAVTVGGADRIRYTSPKAVLILGANDGVFPAYAGGSGILTEEERCQLRDSGLKLANDAFLQCVEERYYAYMAAAAPSHKLYVSYICADKDYPSAFVGMILNILPGCVRQRAADDREWESYREMFDRLAAGYRDPTAETSALRAVIADRPDYEGRLKAVCRSATGVPFRLKEKDTAARLFGTDMCLSASRVKKFYQCRFAYFCRYGLHIQSRPTAEVNGAVFGSIVHAIMEKCMSEYAAPGGLIDKLVSGEAEQGEALTAAVRADAHRVTEEYIRDVLGGADDKTGAFMYRVSLAETAAVRILLRELEELQQSSFRPKDFELEIFTDRRAQGEQDGILSLCMSFPGGTVKVKGKVDRVDLYIPQEGEPYVRIVDYKTGSDTFRLGHLTAGIDAQMLLYLFIVCNNAGRYAEKSGALHPAGVLYQKLVTPDENKNEPMSGLVLDDRTVVEAMEKDGQKKYIPVKIEPDGTVSGSTVTEKQFRLLRSVVERLLVSMARDLLAGDIAAMALDEGQKTACAYCDYRAICGRTEESDLRPMDSRKDKEILEALENGEVTGDE